MRAVHRRTVEADLEAGGPASRGKRCATAGRCGSTLTMNFPDLETEALKLPTTERARLAETLLESLDALSAEEHDRLWTEEALRRDAELDADPSRARPADDVFRTARERLR